MSLKPKVIEELAQHFLGGEIFVGNFSRSLAVTLVVHLDSLESFKNALQGLEREQPLAGRQHGTEACVLRDHRTSGCQVARAAFAEPAASQTHIEIPCDRKLATRCLDVVAVAPRIEGQRGTVDKQPGVVEQQLL